MKVIRLQCYPLKLCIPHGYSRKLGYGDASINETSPSYGGGERIFLPSAKGPEGPKRFQKDVALRLSPFACLRLSHYSLLAAAAADFAVLFSLARSGRSQRDFFNRRRETTERQKRDTTPQLAAGKVRRMMTNGRISSISEEISEQQP